RWPGFLSEYDKDRSFAVTGAPAGGDDIGNAIVVDVRRYDGNSHMGVRAADRCAVNAEAFGAVYVGGDIGWKIRPGAGLAKYDVHGALRIRTDRMVSRAYED